MNLRHRNIDPTPERLTRAAEHARWLADVINTTPERYAWLALREGKSHAPPPFYDKMRQTYIAKADTHLVIYLWEYASALESATARITELEHQIRFHEQGNPLDGGDTP